MTNIEIRIAMANDGWRSEEELTDLGFGDQTGFKCFFSRYDWHGKFCDSIYFSKSTTDLTKTFECVEKAANLAKKAWNDFPDSVPFVSTNGTLLEDELKTSMWKNAPTIEEMKNRRKIVVEEREWMRKGKIQLSRNQYWDMKTLYENKSFFCGHIHRFYCRCDQDDIEDLVNMGFVEYVNEYQNGKLVLSLTVEGSYAVMQNNITTREP